MRRVIFTVVALVAATTFTAPATAAPGGATPKKVLQKAQKAVADDDAEALGRLIPAKEGRDNAQVASILLTVNEVPALVKRARKKFGRKKLRQALGFQWQMLSSMEIPNFGKIAREGEINVNGDKATCELKSGKGSTKRIKLRRADERWYLNDEAIPAGQQLEKAEKSMKEFLQAFDQAITSNDKAKAFAQAIKPEMKKLAQAMQASSPSSK